MNTPTVKKPYKINRRSIQKPRCAPHQIYVTSRTPLNSYKLRVTKLLDQFDAVEVIALGKACVKLCQLYCAIEPTLAGAWRCTWTSGQAKVIDDYVPEDENEDIESKLRISNSLKLSISRAT